MGSEDGMAEANSVERIVGLEVGLVTVGAIVGNSDGWLEKGASEVICAGCVVGYEEGESKGDNEGLSLGIIDGIVVDSCDGKIVGLITLS